MDPAAVPQLYAGKLAVPHPALSAAAVVLGFALAATASAAPAPAETAARVRVALNALRAQGCDGRAGIAAALRESTELADAARRMAAAQLPLRDALRASGYRAIRSLIIQISGDPATDSISRLVADRYCVQLLDPGFRDIGIHRQGRDSWIVIAEPFAPPPPEAADSVARRVLELVNQARMQARMCGNTRHPVAGLLRLNGTLSRTALAHAGDMARRGYFAHEGRDGSTPATRVTRAGYRWRSVGENIATGPAAAEAVVEGWIRSPEHCANLMSARFTEMGVAYAVNPASETGIYWVQLFGAPR